MKLLLLNQTFYPDVAATAQVLTELAVYLRERGHQVTVVTSQYAYVHPSRKFRARETWNGIEIYRVACTNFWKGSKWKRAVNFATFLLSCCARLLTLPRHDVVIALTSPPLISVLGAALAWARRSRFFYWVMDLNPDEAVAAGWLRERSLPARVLEAMSRFSLARAEKVLVLDRFMRDRIAAKGIAPGKIEVIPPWAHDAAVRFDEPGRRHFRQAHGLEDKFVVMYSGNHSPCHPLDTLLEAARRLEDDPEIVFCFVGGGTEYRKIEQMFAPPQGDRASIDPSALGPRGPFQGLAGAGSTGPRNIRYFPYQPLKQLAGSLSAADVQVVVMGEKFLGMVHPCKIYNILSVAAPVLYIGPRPSHVTEIFEQMGNPPQCVWASHGEVDKVVEHIRALRRAGRARDFENFGRAAARFSSQAVLPRLARLLESKSERA